MTNTFDPHAAARHLLAARNGTTVTAHDILPPDAQGAYAVQDATVAALGPVGGWKVGAKGPQALPACAPLPGQGLLASGALLAGGAWQLRGIEVEVAIRLGRDLAPADERMSPADLAHAIDAVMPAIEVVETRLADWRGADPLAQLADLQSHGALILGAACTLGPRDIDLRTVRAHLAFDGQSVADTHGGNPAGDLWRMLAWLAFHCVQRGLPLQAGQVVTTGSCTGMLFAPAGARVRAELAGIGMIETAFQ